jgi:hypothetical protein
MHSFHHSSSPMHLPAAANAPVVLADNGAGDALAATSVIDVDCHLSLVQEAEGERLEITSYRYQHRRLA